MRASDFVPPPLPASLEKPGVKAHLMQYGVLWPLSKVLSPFMHFPPMAHIATKLAEAPPAGAAACDVYACSFFKSGTTWLMHVITQIAFRGEAEFENIHYAVPWIERPKMFEGRMIEYADPSPARLSPTGLRAVKTHVTWEMTPQSPEAHYVAMVRDPKLVAVSGYHFVKALAMGPAMPPFGRWVDRFLSPDFFEGNWAEHAASWWARRDEPNVLFLNYDALLADLGEGVDRISAFMGVDLTPEERAAMVEKTGFAAMKRDALKFDPPRLAAWSKDEAMVRNGSSSRDDALMTPEFARRIDGHFRAELKRLGSDFDYDGAFGR